MGVGLPEDDDIKRVDCLIFKEQRISKGLELEEYKEYKTYNQHAN